MKKDKKKILRYLLVGTAVGLVILTFTPLILNPGKIEPKILSLPYTLWTSILISMILVLLTFLVSRLQDKD
jgi:hypothetical protein